MSFAEERRGGARRAPSRRASRILQGMAGLSLSRNTSRKSAVTTLLPGLAVLVVICLVAIAPMAVPARAQDPPPPTPRITLSPSSGVPGTEVTVRGFNFAADQWVDISYDGTWRTDALTGTAATSFTASFIVPESRKGTHQVLAEGDDDDALASFRVTPGVTVSPTQGPVGTEVTVTGVGFGRDEGSIEIRFGGQVVAEDIEADGRGSWEETIAIPSATGGRHTVRAEGDDRSVATATFDVKPGIMLDKSTGWPGQTIIMTGNAFAADERQIKILFDGEELITGIRANERGHWQEPFVVPEVPRGTYSVTTDGDPTGQEDVDAISFEVRPGLILSPDEGHVGMNTTVGGRGFAPDEDVVIFYEGSEVATATSDEHGSFEVVFIVPESRHGARSITAEDESDNEGTGIFTMESDPPETPELLSPRDEGRAGFVGKVRPRFEWSEVEDPSGVYYRLQISASVNVTSSGEFIDPILSIERLVEEHCTLNKTEALSYGTYYWIVQAVDRAENPGNWTEPYSFRAGLLPMWAFIVIIVGAVLLAGGLVYFFVVRRRMYI